MTMFLAFALAGSAAQAMPMTTQTLAPVCPRDAEPIPAALASWPDKAPLTAASAAATLASTTIVPARAVDLALADTAAVSYALTPSHPGTPGSHGGMVAVTIATAGTYRIAIGTGAWVELVKDGVSLRSTAHGHGPTCSGIRKTVDFALQPGRYVIEIAGNDTPRIGLLLARLS